MAAAVMAFDRTASSAERRVEAVLILLFGIGVAGSSIDGFFGPLQRETALVSLTLGVLGIVAAYRRDRVREAAVIAVAVMGPSPANLVMPALLVPLLIASRLLARGDDARLDRPALDAWRAPLVGGAYLTTAIVGTTCGVGYALGEAQTLSLLGAAMAIAVTAGLVARARMFSEGRS